MSADNAPRFYPEDDYDPFYGESDLFEDELTPDDGPLEDDETAFEEDDFAEADPFADEHLTDEDLAAIFDDGPTPETLRPFNPRENYSGDVNRPHHANS